MDIILAASKEADNMDKNYEEGILNTGKTKVMGSDVISVIRYYSNKSTVEIRVIKEGGEDKVYCSGENYNSDNFYIGYEYVFNADYIYAEGKLVGVIYEQIME